MTWNKWGNYWLFAVNWVWRHIGLDSVYRFAIKSFILFWRVVKSQLFDCRFSKRIKLLVSTFHTIYPLLFMLIASGCFCFLFIFKYFLGVSVIFFYNKDYNYYYNAYYYCCYYIIIIAIITIISSKLYLSFVKTIIIIYHHVGCIYIILRKMYNLFVVQVS